MSARGKLITLEGIDGAGKSTHLTWLVEFFARRSRAVVVTREPGGTSLGEKLRELLLAPGNEMHGETEALLMFAARREHIERVIEPALARGAWVLCDRFSDASFAYQGGGRGVDWGALHTLERWVQHGLQPDLTVFFDLAPELARARAAGVRDADRFEQEQQAFFERVRAAYLRRVGESGGRMAVVDAAQSVSTVQQSLAKLIEPLCP